VYATQILLADEDHLTRDFAERVPQYDKRVADVLDRVLPDAGHTPGRLHEAMRYAVFNGGKRVRPLLVYATGECLGVPEARLDAPAAAIELIHAFSLVHDDLPAMDDDDLRRGMPTVHRQFDEATAILAADALQPLAFSVLTNISNVPADASVRLVRLVADACGSMGMTGGQSIDLRAEGHRLEVDELEHMYALKTGALIHASIMSACVLSDELPDNYVDALEEFGRAIGIAFQIRDDLLDVEGKTAVIGKTAGSDERLNKATYPGLFGIDASRKRCDELLGRGLSRLEVLPDASPLTWLARYIVDRGN
jgi:farnesyl diphosphate synthase